jgi:hypothetical protein
MSARLAALLVAIGLLVGAGGGFAVSHMMDASELTARTALPTCVKVASDMSARDAALIANGDALKAPGMQWMGIGSTTYDGIFCRN